MRYLYGDATPFPHGENFIDTIITATDLCVALFRADAAAEGRRGQADEARRIADRELAELDLLAKAIDGALKPYLSAHNPGSVGHGTAQRLSQSSLQAIAQAKTQVTSRRDGAVRGALGKVLPDQAWALCGKFFVSHSLPRTQWAVIWRGGPAMDESRAEIRAVTPKKLELSFDCLIPQGVMWSGPKLCGELEPGLTIDLPRKAGLRKKVRVRAESLDKWLLTEVTHTPARDAIRLSKPGKTAESLDIVLRQTGQSGVVISVIGPEGVAEDEPITVGAEDAIGLGQLWSQIEALIPELCSHRSTLVSAHLDGMSIPELPRPADLAELVLSSIAPVVREMRLRSRVPGELILKRDLGDGRREELYVPRGDLQRKFEPLADRHRQVFEAMGLGDEATSEFASRLFVPPPPPRGAATADDDDEATVEVEADFDPRDTEANPTIERPPLKRAPFIPGISNK